MLGLKLNHVSKRDPSWLSMRNAVWYPWRVKCEKTICDKKHIRQCRRNSWYNGTPSRSSRPKVFIYSIYSNEACVLPFQMKYYEIYQMPELSKKLKQESYDDVLPDTNIMFVCLFVCLFFRLPNFFRDTIQIGLPAAMTMFDTIKNVTFSHHLFMGAF